MLDFYKRFEFSTEGIVIRGISDLLEYKEEADNSGSQPIAANNAAAFAFQMVTELIKSKDYSISNLDDISFKNNLVNKLSSLYEKGPEEKNIWKRAGGDVSILTNDENRKSQWYSAIDILNKGGGGSITLESLMKEIKEDYPDIV